MPRREQLFALIDTHAMPISAALAMEIGLIESIVLLQFEFLISISDHVHEGRTWTYESLQVLHENYFPFWGTSTLGRAIKSLVAQELLLVGNFNRAGFDRTQWYAINPVGVSRLQSLRLAQSGLSVTQSGTSVTQPKPSTSHTESAIPGITTGITTEPSKIPR